MTPSPSPSPSHLQMSILTICFHAVKRSMRMSDGLSSCGAVFFLIWAGSALDRRGASATRETRD
jgi:hypothetical protein